MQYLNSVENSDTTYWTPWRTISPLASLKNLQLRFRNTRIIATGGEAPILEGGFDKTTIERFRQPNPSAGLVPSGSSSLSMPTPHRICLCYPAEQKHLEQIRRTAVGHEIVNAGQARIAEEILEADIYFGHAKVPIDWDAVVTRGRLKWIQSSAAGIDHCLTPPVIASPIPVTSSAGLFAPQVAEQTCAMLLSILRKLPTFQRAQQGHRFERLPTDDLRSKTIGIIGFGGNGGRIAHVLASFEPRIIAVDLLPEKIVKPPYVELLVPSDQLDEILPYLDIVILCVPLTPVTRGMFNRARFQHFKRGTILINVARGEVVQEDALVEALQGGTLSQAGLDVTEIEPLPDKSPLWDMENVLITPHVGAQSFDRLDRTTQLFCDNFLRFERGRPLLNLVDKARGF
jgi:phosphoglycerate dehydrogenase-like enzyme